MEVFGQFQGRLLAVDEAPQVLEGDWSATRVVLMSFPDEAAFRDWYGSPAYQEIARHRHDGSTGVVLLTKGLPG